MSISRRHFLLFSGTALVSAGTSFSLSKTKQQHQTLAKTPAHSSASLSQMHSSTFETLSDKTFLVITDQGERLPLQLDQVEDQGQSNQLEQFSLTFRGNEGHSLTQGTYKLEHPQLGHFSLFLVPTGDPTQSAYYQAAFSRLVV